MLKLASSLLSLALSLAPAAACAADWSPPGPIRLLIGFSAGGAADAQARAIARTLEDRLGWTVAPEQRTGLGGVVALTSVAKAPPDGATLAMIVSGALSYNAMSSGMAELGLENFTLIATTARFQMGLVARAGSEFDTWDKVQAAARERPVTVGAASDRIADVTWRLSRTQGLNFNIVQVPGGAAALERLADDRIKLAWVAGAQADGVAAGRLVNILSGLPVPLKQSPDAPTLAQIGGEFDLDGYFMVVGPAGMSQAARDALAAAIEDAATAPGTQASALLRGGFGGATVLTGDALDAYMRAEVDSSERLLEAVSR